MNSINASQKLTNDTLVVYRDKHINNDVHECHLVDYSDIINNSEKNPREYQKWMPGILRHISEIEDTFNMPIDYSIEELTKDCNESKELAKKHQEESKKYKQDQKSEEQKILRQKNDLIKKQQEENDIAFKEIENLKRKNSVSQHTISRIESDLTRANRQLESAHYQIHLLEAELREARATIQTLQQALNCFNLYSNPDTSTTRIVEEPTHPISSGKESWGTFLRTYAPGFVVGLFGFKESSTTPSNRPRSSSIQNQSGMNDIGSSSDVDDALRCSKGPAPPPQTWGARIVVWIQMTAHAFMEGLQKILRVFRNS